MRIRTFSGMVLNMDTRKLRLRVDSSSWPPGHQVARTLATLGAHVHVSINAALLHTAFWTRPPVVTGFSLSDTWAWLRYRPAFDDSPDLALRAAWDDIDPHQKTILSDELGVGFTTSFLAEHLDIMEFADTTWVLRCLLPEIFGLGPTSKRGPKKSPDYMAIDSSLRVLVLECKGTQSSAQHLAGQLADGVSQKNNVLAPCSTLIYSRVVGGLFVPQAGNVDSAELRFRDPPFEWFAEREIDERDLQLAILQVSLAKHLALVGLVGAANRLARTPTQALDQFELSSQQIEHVKRVSDASGMIWRRAEHVIPDLAAQVGRRILRGSTGVHSSRILKMLNADGVGYNLRGLLQQTRGQKIVVEETEQSSEVRLPTGFRARLEWLDD